MTDEEQAEYELLKLANDKGKFAIPMAANMTDDHSDALERLQLREWIKLIDVSPLSIQTGKVFRVFMITPAARTWYRRQTQ
jgi:hypothetical protein